MRLVQRGKKRSPKHHFHQSRKSQLLEDYTCSVGTLKPASTFDEIKVKSFGEDPWVKSFCQQSQRTSNTSGIKPLLNLQGADCQLRTDLEHTNKAYFCHLR